jgi:hypothetical protein
LGGAKLEITRYRGVRQLVRQAPLDDDAIDRTVKNLHIGRAVVRDRRWRPDRAHGAAA